MSETGPKQHFSENQQMDFEVQAVLGGCYYGSADAGEVMVTIDRIREGDFESWVRHWHGTAGRVEKYAVESEEEGNRVSAREAFLRAASYYSATLSMIDGSRDPERRVPYWKQHMHCFERFCELLDPAGEKVEIPYEEKTMPGYFFRPPGSDGPWATIILNNGSDGPTSAMWTLGVAGALRRGYAALIFDGPGQNSLLWLHDVPFRYDWEKVITPVTDFLLERDDVDPERIALSGISQGGYWILRALAFEHRIAAGIADPGVMDVFTVMRGKFPREMLELVDSGQEEVFNNFMDQGINAGGDAARQEIHWRMKPYGTDNYYQWLKTAEQFNVRDCIQDITCPMFIADPDDEQFWPGQSKEVYDALTCQKTLVRFTREEGANWHCEPKARGLYDQRMFDWLDKIMMNDE